MSSPQERSNAARIAAFTRASKYDGATVTAIARDARFAQFEKQVDPEGTLSAEERYRRAKALQRAHMARIAKKAHEARRRKKLAS